MLRRAFSGALPQPVRGCSFPQGSSELVKPRRPGAGSAPPPLACKRRSPLSAPGGGGAAAGAFLRPRVQRAGRAGAITAEIRTDSVSPGRDSRLYLYLVWTQNPPGRPQPRRAGSQRGGEKSRASSGSGGAVRCPRHSAELRRDPGGAQPAPAARPPREPADLLSPHPPNSSLRITNSEPQRAAPGSARSGTGCPRTRVPERGRRTGWTRAVGIGLHLGGCKAGAELRG